MPPQYPTTNNGVHTQVSTQSLNSLNNLTPTKANPIKAKDQGRFQFKILPSSKNQNNSNNNSNSQFKKILGRFNKKSHSKDLESHVDLSAPSLKSITRSPSPSVYIPPSQHQHHSLFHTSSSTSSFQNPNNVSNASLPSGHNLTRTNSSHNISVTSSNSSIAAAAAANQSNSGGYNTSQELGSQLDTSLTKLNLQDQQQFVGEHVLKIYKNDQTFKYLVVHKETSTKEVVMLALNEFSILDDIGSNAYSLCEVSVDQDRLIKQKRLPDQLNNLAERLPLNARYYLKSNKAPEQFLADSASMDELIKVCHSFFLFQMPSLLNYR